MLKPGHACVRERTRERRSECMLTAGCPRRSVRQAAPCLLRLQRDSTRRRSARSDALRGPLPRPAVRPAPRPPAPPSASPRALPAPPPPFRERVVDKPARNPHVIRVQGIARCAVRVPGEGRLRAGSPRNVQNYRLTVVCQSVHCMCRGRVLSRENGTSACWIRQKGGLQK